MPATGPNEVFLMRAEKIGARKKQEVSLSERELLEADLYLVERDSLGLVIDATARLQGRHENAGGTGKPEKYALKAKKFRFGRNRPNSKRGNILLELRVSLLWQKSVANVNVAAEEFSASTNL